MKILTVSIIYEEKYLTCTEKLIIYYHYKMRLYHSWDWIVRSERAYDQPWLTVFRGSDITETKKQHLCMQLSLYIFERNACIIQMTYDFLLFLYLITSWWLRCLFHGPMCVPPGNVFFVIKQLWQRFDYTLFQEALSTKSMAWKIYRHVYQLGWSVLISQVNRLTATVVPAI